MATDLEAYERGFEAGRQRQIEHDEYLAALERVRVSQVDLANARDALREANAAGSHLQDLLDEAQKQLARHERGTEIRADGKEVPKDRWEQAFRAIASRFIGCREGFEVEPLTRDILAFLDEFKATNGSLVLDFDRAFFKRLAGIYADKNRGCTPLFDTRRAPHDWQHPIESDCVASCVLETLDLLFPNGAPE